MDLDFEATRRRADDRLHQELTRIRNLPKRSKITICKKHGLQHAHHMNTGIFPLQKQIKRIKERENQMKK